ncbi:Transcription factor [Penicillium cf. griseofulvum]|nr:Transcription factor [Penicillium cf. griseofulvum]
MLGEDHDRSSVPVSSQILLAAAIEVENSMGANNTLLDLYYKYFHRSHPFVLPRSNLQAKLASEWSSLRALLAVMQYIGSSYGSGESSSRRERMPDEQSVDVVDGFVVQTTLLLALAKSMCAERAASEVLLAKAIEQARLIGMHTKAFADMAAEKDPVLAESWRRTWWMLYLADLNFSVIRYDFITSIPDTDHDVDLPCDDLDYYATDIPRTTASSIDYRNREYALEATRFSSFAYLIDATRIFVCSLRVATQYENPSKAELLCSDLEASIVGWFVMLPPDKWELAVQPDLLDQLIFQAHMMMYTALAYIHRPLSNLQYDPAEDLSSCGTPPRPLVSSTITTSAFNHRMHSDKLFQAVRNQNQCLILLPLGAAQLSPFLICMIACCTIAYLVACKSGFTPDEVEVARSRIRVCLGTLKHYENIWPRAKNILHELRVIANALMQADSVPQAPGTRLDLLAEQDAMVANIFDADWFHPVGSMI